MKTYRESVIKEHLNGNNKYFAQDTSFARKFEELGALAFNWKDLPSFLDSTSFKQYLTPERNILLIKHLKSTSDSEKVKKINTKFLKSLSFIKDHRNNIKSPEQVCFPSADDVNWNNLDTELSFVHEEILNWLNNDSEHRAWLENLGVVERSDITYITQTIIPNIDTYITNDNAIEAIQNLFRLYRKGDLKENLIKQLSSIKLLTQKGYLCPAKDCFFSNYYAPNLKIENILEPDIFVNELYCPQNADKEEWKRFFKFLGVKENIEIQEFSERIPNNQLIDRGFNEHYFSEEDKKFTPWINTFTAYSHQNISTFELLNFTEKNSKFSFIFWQNVLRNELPDAIVSPSTAFWGDTGRPGEKTGNKVENYIPWYICYIECIPTLDDSCKTAPDTFLNTEEIRKIADKYLPIFDGPDLSPNWRAFFNFRTELKLFDYLQILSKIASDIDDDGRIKRKNYKRIQSVYSELLKRCSNWNNDELTMMKEWSEKELLLNTKEEFSSSNTLKFFLDGNESIFQGQFDFINLNAENRNHPNIEILLNCFQVGILRQSDFELVYSQVSECINLINSLERIMPYFKVWIMNDIYDDETEQSLNEIASTIKTLNIYESEELEIKYEDIEFTKSVNIHFDNDDLYVTTPWYANCVLLQLPEILCRYLNLRGHDKKLDFLLRSTNDEIVKYFIQESIDIPQEILDAIQEDTSSELSDTSSDLEILHKKHTKVNSFSDIQKAIEIENIPSEYFDMSRADYNSLKYIESLIPRAVKNIVAYLSKHPDYVCTHHYRIVYNN